MSGLAPPTRAHSGRLPLALSTVLLALLEFGPFDSLVVQAEEAHPEYGTVIGVGTCHLNNE